MNKTATTIKIILVILFPIICTSLASKLGNIFVTVAAFILSLAALVYVFRGNVLLAIGMNRFSKDREKGVKLMKAAYKTGKLSPAQQLYYAYLILRAGEIDDAENAMNKATVIGKHSLNDLQLKQCEFNRAIITWKRGDLSSAIVGLEELYADGYRTSGLYGTLGSFYLMNKEFERSVSFAKEGIEYNSDDKVSYDNLGQAYIGLGMLDEAQKVYEELIPQKPAFLEPYYNYAAIMEKKGELKPAKYYYETALTYEEKFLSTVTHDEICECIQRVEELML